MRVLYELYHSVPGRQQQQQLSFLPMQNILSITTSCHVVISVLSLLATSSSQERCGQGASCRGERPKLANGCCPVEQNQACRPDVGDDCDTQLGYNCVNDVGTVVTAGQGTCRGQYNLTAQSVGVNSVNLTWTHVARPLDMYEYVILYRETNYPLGDSGWTPKDVGESPKGLLKDLTPGTLYSIKVGIWTVRSTGNYSEVIMVETQPASFCEHLSTHYAVGQQFVHECEDNCTCLPTGELQCQPVCPGALGIPQAPEEGCEYERGSDCCTYVKRCPVPAESCSYNNETYPHGHEFDLGCQVCECSLGQVTCQYPLGCGAMEATVSCPSPKISGVDEDCCPIRYCESTCTFENRTYQHMEYFTSSECGLCQCSTVDGVQCASECPPVVMVLPSAACPDPHIKKEGCCETLYCHDTSRDILHYIRNVFSLSYSPSMLTLSFEVESQREENGHPTYCQYEILSTNTNDSFGNWSRRLVQPVDVQIQQDQSTHKEPADALTRESAIVVGKRAYVTVSGMQPNTTYFVKIIPLDGLREDMSESHTGQINYSDRNISAMVVARTRPLFNVTSCFHDGREVHHEEVIAAHCGQHCQCLLGKIQCHSTCDAEGYVVARSRTCPIPRLEKTEEQCCPQWTCHPSATGCIYNGLIMTTGQTVYDACQVCKCANGSVQCTPVCQPNGEAPRPGCELTNISGQCCSQWMCPLDSQDPTGIRSSTVLQFNGACDSPESKFKEMVGERLMDYVFRQPACRVKINLCDFLDVAVTCPDGLHGDLASRRKRRNIEVNKIYVHVSVYQNFSSSSTKESTVEQVRLAGLRLLTLLNTRLDIPLDNGQSLQFTNIIIHEGLSYICERNFEYVKDLDKCILSEIESVQTFQPNVRLATSSVLDTSASLQWSILEPQDLTEVQSFIVEYRQGGSLQWLASHVLEPTQRTYNITSLKPDVTFNVRLQAVMSWSGSSKWTVAETSFTTSATSAEPSTMTYVFPLNNVKVQETWAVLGWDPLPGEIMTQLSAVSVIYRQSYNSYYTNKQSVPFRSQSQVQLTGLMPDTAYTAEISLLLYSGVIKSSGPVHFVTKSPRNVSSELLAAVIISCVVSFIASVIVVMTCFMWRKSKKKGDTTGFENKTFGIPLENNNEGSPICLPTMNAHTSITTTVIPTSQDSSTVNLATASSSPVNPASN